MMCGSYHSRSLGVGELSSSQLAILYSDVQHIAVTLREYRLFWVLDYMRDTADDLRNEYKDRMTPRDMLFCKRLSSPKFIHSIKLMAKDADSTRMFVAKLLYDMFKICRKIKLSDKLIVVENFNLNRIEK
jgi:hypothetical protein